MIIFFKYVKLSVSGNIFNGFSTETHGNLKQVAFLLEERLTFAILLGKLKTATVLFLEHLYLFAFDDLSRLK